MGYYAIECPNKCGGTAIFWSGMNDEPRCLITSNPCGTDTWMVDDCCSCANCRRFMVAQANKAIRMCAELGRDLAASQADRATLNAGVERLTKALEFEKARHGGARRTETVNGRTDTMNNRSED